MVLLDMKDDRILFFLFSRCRFLVFLIRILVFFCIVMIVGLLVSVLLRSVEV